MTSSLTEVQYPMEVDLLLVEEQDLKPVFPKTGSDCYPCPSKIQITGSRISLSPEHLN